MTDPNKTTSKFLSLVLRHQPETIGLMLDENGWAEVSELIEKMNAHQHPVTIESLETIVATSDKKRFSFSEDCKRIRANQGHSVDVDLQLTEQIPPDVLYHGTAAKNIDSIKENGIIKGARHHVHLSADRETARRVGMRHGSPVIIVIDAKKMQEDGVIFYQSENAVWLTDIVSPTYLVFENAQ